MTDDKIFAAISVAASAGFFLLAALVPRLRDRKFDVSTYLGVGIGPVGLWFRIGPKRTMRFSSRTFVIFGCVIIALSLLVLADHHFDPSGTGSLLIFAFGALLMSVVYVSVAFDSISGDNPKTLHSETHNDEDIV